MLVLHAAYAFVPLGALALGIHILFGWRDTAAAQHLWMAGAIGAMTLAVMTRATLGHTGRGLHANAPTVAIYLALFAAVGTRLLATEVPALSYASGALWMIAFGGFLREFGPLLLFARKTQPA